MKINDEAKWSALQQELRSAGETGQQFQDYMTFWVEAAETIMSQDPDVRPHRAINEAMALAEVELGQMDGEYLGAMLLYIVGLWAHGTDVFEHMTTIEQKVVQTAAMHQVAHLQTLAGQNDDPTATNDD